MLPAQHGTLHGLTEKWIVRFGSEPIADPNRYQIVAGLRCCLRLRIPQRVQRLWPCEANVTCQPLAGSDDDQLGWKVTEHLSSLAHPDTLKTQLETWPVWRQESHRSFGR